MPEDYVSDNEVLYRRVPVKVEYFERISNGTYRVTSQAFSDREKKVSVDRAKLMDNDPTLCMTNYSDCVVSVTASQVRSWGDIPSRTEGQNRKLDVVPDPLEEQRDDLGNILQRSDPAHALILSTPEFAEGDSNHFKKLKMKLSKHHKWEIELTSTGIEILLSQTQ